MKKLALVLVIAAAIVLAVVYFTPEPSPIVAPEPQTLTVSNFAFSEVATGPVACNVKVENKVIFSGPITKPTPCNGLTANYTIEGDIVKINILTTPFEGFCSQVLQDTFYTGSFDTSQSADVQIYYGGEKICDKTLSITGCEKNFECDQNYTCPNGTIVLIQGICSAGQCAIPTIYPCGQIDKEQSCINSGGTVTTGMCCKSASDFPGTCVIGACGCSLENSYSVKMCDCGEGSCFNGNSCTEPCIGSGCPTY